MKTPHWKHELMVYMYIDCMYKTHTCTYVHMHVRVRVCYSPLVSLNMMGMYINYCFVSQR